MGFNGILIYFNGILPKQVPFWGWFPPSLVLSIFTTCLVFMGKATSGLKSMGGRDLEFV